ncbi:MAG: T9SS type A sorting domain-containing protein [Ignavibacteriae bacterium]|nr:T9SS type A sorting domain-containing protein [Ignavibacteriota bacterium]
MYYKYNNFLVFIILLFSTSSLLSQTILFHESFDDANYTTRGWYDSPKFNLDSTDFIGNSGSSAKFTFLQGERTPKAGGRIQFTPSEEVYLSYRVKYSANYVGSKKPYHPHEFQFVTNENDKWVGPAYTHLTTYIEHNGGKPILAIQDGDNVDENNIGVDLKDITENRAVAGCNGSSDEYPAGDCYQCDDVHCNGKQWKASKIYFSDSVGPYYKNDWHFIEAYFKLNSIQDGKGIPDGIIRYWYDGTLIIDAPNAALRTGAFPDMNFNQFLVLPYIGDGSPVDQTMWIDELTVASSRIETAVDEKSEEQTQLEIFPNPVDETSFIRFYLNESENVKINVYDVLGNLFSTIYNDRLDKGGHLILLNPNQKLNDLSNGIYIVKVELNSGNIIKLITINN